MHYLYVFFLLGGINQHLNILVTICLHKGKGSENPKKLDPQIIPEIIDNHSTLPELGLFALFTSHIMLMANEK